MSASVAAAEDEGKYATDDDQYTDDYETYNEKDDETEEYEVTNSLNFIIP
jgi:hypothetical protein